MLSLVKIGQCSGSEEEYENKKSLRQRSHKDDNDRQQINSGQKSSREPSAKLNKKLRVMGTVTWDRLFLSLCLTLQEYLTLL